MIDVRIGVPDATPEVLAVCWDASGLRLGSISTRLLPLAARSVLETFAGELEAAPPPDQPRELTLPGELPSRVLVCGLGDGSPEVLRRVGAGLARAAKAAQLTITVPPLEPAAVSALAEGLMLGAYRFSARGVPAGALQTVWLEGVDAGTVERGLTFGRATCWARDLANTRTSTKTPAWLAEAASRELVPLGVHVQVRDEAWLAARGFGGVLAVGMGSASPPRLIEARWGPRGAISHVVIVGKGITFDTGGLNLKPGDSMSTMYTDMAGAAAALGAVRAAAQLRTPVRVTAVLPVAENAVSGSSMRPGDVIRHYGGRTSEVRNTDAEGRLVLADALAYAAARLRPTVLVDIATLTGAAKVALGLRTGGLFATSDELAQALLTAGARAGELLWRMPFVADYAAQLDSAVADAQNSPGNPGAITAALFLRPFTAGLPWAHLDIAGPARAAADSGAASRGATGFGASLLARFIESYV